MDRQTPFARLLHRSMWLMKLNKSWIIALTGWVLLQIFTVVQLKAVFRVGVFYEWDFLNGKEYISKLTANSTNTGLGSVQSSISSFSIDFDPYSIKDLSLSQITYLFCKKIINQDISAIVLHTKDTRLTKYLAYLASHLWIPQIGTAANDPSLSDKVPFIHSPFIFIHIFPFTWVHAVIQYFVTCTFLVVFRQSVKPINIL